MIFCIVVTHVLLNYVETKNDKMRLTFKELKDEISKIVPKSIEYKVDLEAGNIAIITTEPEKFGGGDGLVGKIAKKVKRKIKIRPDPSIVKPEQEAKATIESIIPEKPKFPEYILMHASVK